MKCKKCNSECIEFTGDDVLDDYYDEDCVHCWLWVATYQCKNCGYYFEGETRVEYIDNEDLEE